MSLFKAFVLRLDDFVQRNNKFDISAMEQEFEHHMPSSWFSCSAKDRKFYDSHFDILLFLGSPFSSSALENRFKME